jgi:hypothetical protein
LGHVTYRRLKEIRRNVVEALEKEGERAFDETDLLTKNYGFM